jgi:adenosylcobinamide-GDP ribazoletransferase
VVTAAVAGRTVALYPWVGLPNARDDGLAVTMGRPTPGAFRRAVLLGLAIAALLVAWRSPVGFVLGALAAALAAKGVASLADRKIGGHTGDVIGAAVILGDLSYLAAFTMWLS